VSTRQPVKRSVLFTERDLPGFLDMLRYDGATVVAWDQQARESSRQDGTVVRTTVYEVTLRGDTARIAEYQFTVDRWHSFGLNISDPIR
jgi:hypothetical protein